MKKVLVTGANGFIGRSILPRLLKEGYEVHAVSSRIIRDDNIVWHNINLLDISKIQGLFNVVKPTHLLHLAWDTRQGKYLSSIENLYWIQSSIELMKNFHKYNGERIVYAGSCFEYDLSYGYLKESVTPMNPDSLYGTSKASLQQVLQKFSTTNKVNFAWGRIFFVYGKYEKPQRLVPYVINSLIKGETAYCSHGGQIRDFLNVHDVASAFIHLLKNDFTGEVNIGSGNPIKLRDMVQLIGQKLNREELLRFDKKIPANEPKLIVADNTKLKTEIKWSPKYDLIEGLDETIEWWKNTGGKLENG